MDPRITPLLTAILEAVKTAAGRQHDLDDEHIFDAFTEYQDYFSRPRQDPDEDPPVSTDPVLDDLLYEIWLVLVQRETEGLDAGLLDGSVPGPYGPVSTYNELYHGIFRAIVASAPDAEEDEWNPVAVMALAPESVASVAEELGVRFSAQADQVALPPEILDLLRGTEQDTPRASIKQARKLIKRFPEQPILHLILAQLYLTEDQVKQARLVARKGADTFPQYVGLVGLVLSLQETPEAMLAQGYRLGAPPDLRRFNPQADGTYALSDYILFESSALALDIAAGREDDVPRRMERLLTLTFPESAVLERVPYLFGKRIEQALIQGKFLPATWPAPPQDPNTPLANDLLAREWTEFVAALAEENQVFSPPDPIHPPRQTGARIRTLGKRATDPQQIFQVKITLQHIRPPIWRRLLLPASTELKDVHRVIQAAFGWLDYHLHQFMHGREHYAAPSPYDIDDFARDYAGLTLANFLHLPKDKLLYEYDFGDSWRHEIILEKVLEADPKVRYPRCIKGKRNRPPEDVGGPWGYEHYLAVLNDPQHEEHKDMLAWSGGGYDPEAFDLAEVNARLGG